MEYIILKVFDPSQDTTHKFLLQNYEQHIIGGGVMIEDNEFGLTARPFTRIGDCWQSTLCSFVPFLYMKSSEEGKPVRIPVQYLRPPKRTRLDKRCCTKELHSFGARSS